MPTEVIAYKCDYCHKCFGKRQYAIAHEGCCNNNPARKNCKTCVYGCTGEIDVYVPLTVESYIPDSSGVNRYPGDEKYDGPYCAKFEKPIYQKPYFDECDTDDGCHGYREEMPIQGTCWNYKYKGFAKWTLKSEFKEADHAE
jgi:hypothetical protein